MITFAPNVTPLGVIEPLPITSSPNFAGCSLAFAKAHGSPAQRRILAAVERWLDVPKGYTATVTSKLARGHGGAPMTLAKPGWHWDGFEHVGARPDFDSWDPKVKHFVVNFHADPEWGTVAPTEYAVQSIAIPGADPYPELAAAMRGQPTAEFEANTLYAFDQQTVHRSGYVRRPGWRMFVRVSVSRRVPIEVVDTLPVQVYMDLAAADHGR
ncbi:MAG TPA: hypothetical protein VGD46_05070 [Rhizobacter sp.]